MNRLVSIAAMLSLFGCNGSTGEQQTQASGTNEAPSNVAAEPASNAALPYDRTPLSEPDGPIDPKSAEAAGQVVQHYGALIEQHRMSEAAKLWGDSGSASDFAVQLRRYPEAHLEIGKPSEPEGAAGSSYVTEPVVFYGRDENGNAFRRAAAVTLRRVNDVPGSTEAQRRWHIERIEWAR